MAALLQLCTRCKTGMSVQQTQYTPDSGLSKEYCRIFRDADEDTLAARLEGRCSLQVDFMRRHSFDYEALAGEEYQVLKPDLVKVQESVGNSAFANEIKQATSRDAFFKVRPILMQRL